MNRLLVSAAVAALAGTATAQIQCLASDTALDQIVRLADLNGDGDFNDAGEVSVFFDGSNVSGVFGTGSVFGIAQASDGTVYIGDGDTDTIYRLKDLNGDGDANDAGEASVFYSGINGFAIQTPNGIAISGSGIYVTTAGAGSTTSADAIIRLQDLDGDGDADDAGESVVWLDLSQVSGSTPFGIVAREDGVYFVDLLGAGNDVIFHAADTDGDGVVNPATELTTFLDTGAVTAPVGFGIVAADDAFYVIEGSGSAQRLHRLIDADNSGAIDASEAVLAWQEVQVGGALGSAFDLTITSVNGVRTIVLPSSGAEAADNVFILSDLDGDGLFLGANESVTALAGGGSGVFPDTLRAIRAYTPTAPACPADFNADGFLDFFDYDDFVACFETGQCPADKTADFNGDEFVDFFDYDAYVVAFETGC